MASGRQKRKRAPVRQAAQGQKRDADNRRAAPPPKAPPKLAGPLAESRRESSGSGARASATRDSTADNRRRPAFLRGTFGWVTTVVSGIIIAAGGVWLLDFARSVGDSSGPAMAAVGDIDPLSTRCYALADPITSASDKVTLLSGTASPAQVSALIARHGGVNVGRLVLTLILTGRRSSLRIVNIQPQVHKVKPPTAALLQYASAGTVDITQVSSNLDSPFAQLEESSQPYFNSQEIDLVNGERQTFRITFEATTGSWAFNLLVTYVTGGQQYEQAISGPSHGYFLLSGLDTRYGTVYSGVNENQFEVASEAQSRLIFSKTEGCS